MTTVLPIAHAGHWIAGLLYLVPLFVVGGMLTFTARRDRRAEAEEIAAGRPPRDSDPDESELY